MAVATSSTSAPALPKEDRVMESVVQPAGDIENQDGQGQIIGRFARLESSLKTVQPFLGLILLLVIFLATVGLGILACGWVCVIEDIQFLLPRTFAWEMIMQIFGSFLNDCVDRTNNDFVGIPYVSSDRCMYTMSAPWIPLFGTGICVGIVILVIVGWGYQLLAKNSQDSNSGSRDCLKATLIVMVCFIPCIYFGAGIMTMKGVMDNVESKLLGRMKYSMGQRSEVVDLDIMLHQINERWTVTQKRRKCCGINSANDWKFSIFDVGKFDPRYPLSCCNTDVNIQCTKYPDRYKTWNEGCFEKELTTVKNYEEKGVLFIILTWSLTILIAAVSWILSRFLENRPLVPQVVYQAYRVFGSNFLLRFRSAYLRNRTNNPNVQENVVIQPDQSNQGKSSSGSLKENKETSGNQKDNLGSKETNASNEHWMGASGDGVALENEPSSQVQFWNREEMGNIDLMPIYTRRYSKYPPSSDRNTSEVQRKLKNRVRKETLV